MWGVPIAGGAPQLFVLGRGNARDARTMSA